MTEPAKPVSPRRREFLLNAARTAGGVGLIGLALGLYSRHAAGLPAWAIRPPGALDEDAFDGACIRCGLCVRACPFDMLHLAQPGQGLPTGTPYFIARQAGCEMCEDIPCVAACPTGALDAALADINDADMGLAVLIDQENCIAFQGLRCEVCFNICPRRGAAITLDLQRNTRSGKHALFIPVVHSGDCTGCGKCEEACILDAAAIKVLPRHLAKGALGAHYRSGWTQQKRAGGALVTPDPEHRYNLPEGMRYEHGGRGLIDDNDGPPATGGEGGESLNRRGPP